MTTTNPSRNIALDVLRGMTIALMILVNTPGTWEAIWWPLGHAAWHGYTPTDLVFPFFLFITGSAMFFALKRFDYQPSPGVLKKLGKRVLIIFGIGIFLHWYPFTKAFEDLRIMGVLQRIAIAYGIASLAVLYLSTRGLVIFSAVILFVYWLVLFFAGTSPEPYSIENTIVRVVDLAILGESHMFPHMHPTFEPEGLLSTIPAIVNVTVGFWVTKALSTMSDNREKFQKLMLWGVALVIIGQLWGIIFPISKNLWTSSYVVVSSGWAFIVLGLLIVICATEKGQRVMEPFRIYGTNPLFIYALSWLWVSTYWLIPMDLNGESVGFGRYMYEAWFLPLLGNKYVASHTYAFVHVLLFWFISWAMYKKKIFIKI